MRTTLSWKQLTTWLALIAGSAALGSMSPLAGVQPPAVQQVATATSFEAPSPTPDRWYRELPINMRMSERAFPKTPVPVDPGGHWILSITPGPGCQAETGRAWLMELPTTWSPVGSAGAGPKCLTISTLPVDPLYGADWHAAPTPNGIQATQGVLVPSAQLIPAQNPIGVNSGDAEYGWVSSPANRCYFIILSRTLTGTPTAVAYSPIFGVVVGADAVGLDFCTNAKNNGVLMPGGIWGANAVATHCPCNGTPHPSSGTATSE